MTVRSIARALARGRLLPSMSLASLVVLQACGGTLAPATNPTPIATPSTSSTIAGIVKQVADGLSGVEARLGLGSGDLAKLTSLTSQLAGIAQQITAAGGSGGASSLLSDAEGVIGLVTPFISSKNATLLQAIETAMNTAQGLISGRRMAAAAPGAMTHDQAMGILRDAAAGRLPR